MKMIVGTVLLTLGLSGFAMAQTQSYGSTVKSPHKSGPVAVSEQDRRNIELIKRYTPPFSSPKARAQQARQIRGQELYR